MSRTERRIHLHGDNPLRDLLRQRHDGDERGRAADGVDGRVRDAVRLDEHLAEPHGHRLRLQRGWRRSPAKRELLVQGWRGRPSGHVEFGECARAPGGDILIWFCENKADGELVIQGFRGLINLEA